MNRHPSTIATPGTATSGRRNVYNDEMIAAAIGSKRHAHEAMARIVRRAVISEFSHQHDALPSPDDWDADLKMMFAISYPEVTL